MNKVLVFTLLGLILAANANATVIMTVEPDNFANGTDISNATPGVILRMGTVKYASTGTKVFGYDAGLGFGIEPYWDNQNTFNAFFGNFTKYVDIDVINNNGAGYGTDTAYMEVFTVTNGLLETKTIASSSIGFPGSQNLSFQTFGNTYITRIQLSSSDGSDFNLDRLQFSVPEPGSLALMSIGLLGYFSRCGRQVTQYRA
jgi:hypothetical protein